MKNTFRYLMIFALLSATSCLKDRIDDKEAEVCLCFAEGEKDITLTLDMPYTSPKTGNIARHAIDKLQENAIETLDVLAFNKDNNSFMYRAIAHNTGSNSDASQQTFRVRINMENLDKQRFTLISNAREQINELFDGVSWDDWDKEDMLKRLVIELPYDPDTETFPKWNATSASDYDRLPMWGEVDADKINNPVKMLRMTAKIDVVVASQVQSRFLLKSVHLYNTNSAGRIVPNSDNIAGMVAQDASLHLTGSPGDPDEFRVNEAIMYNDFTPPGQVDIAMRGAIYLFETKAKNEGEFLSETFMVIGGVFVDPVNNPGNDITYYRIDFFNNDGITHLDILRNHSYVCTINGISDTGYSDPEAARLGTSYSDIIAEVKPWDDGILRSFVFNNLHVLGVSSKKIEIEGSESDYHILNIYTDFPDGWNAIVLDSDGEPLQDNWLQLNIQNGVANNQADVRLLAAPNPYMEIRRAVIHISAGWLNIEVEVEQGEKEETIVIIPNFAGMLDYEGSEAPTPVSVTVIPLENDGTTIYNGNWTLTSEHSWLSIALTGNAPSQTISGIGEQEVFLYAPFNSGDVRAGSLSAALQKDGRDIDHYVLIVEQDADPDESIVIVHDSKYLLSAGPNAGRYVYLLNGEDINLHVRSNKKWVITNVTQESTDYFGNKILIADNEFPILSQAVVNELLDNDITWGDNSTSTLLGTPLDIQVNLDRSRWGLLRITFEGAAGVSVAPTTVELMFALPEVTILGISSNTTATLYGHNPAYPSHSNDANTMLRTAINFGLNANSSVYSRGFTFRTRTTDFLNLPAGLEALRSLLDAKPDIVVLSYNLLIWDSNVAVYREYIDKGGVLIVFSETEYSRALVNNILPGASVNYGRFAGSVYEFFDVDDPVTNGPFGDIRGKDWGEDASTTNVVTIPPAQINNVVLFSNGYDKSSRDGNTNRYSAFRHKDLGFIFVGDAGNLSSLDRNSSTICPLQIDQTTKTPITKLYGNIYARRFDVYNSHFFANMITWAITRTTINHNYHENSDYVTP